MSEDKTPRPRPQRADGEQSRERLLRAALRLFAQKGFDKTSTREIAEAAGTNLAAIRYYFGDKAGLYRAVYLETQGDPAADIARYADPSLPLREALRGLYEGFIAPLREGDTAQLCVKLHAREYLEPTGLWQQEIHESIRPAHEALLQVLQRHLGLATPDDELRRLGVCLAGLGVHLHVCTDVIEHLAPALHRGPRGHDQWLERLVMYGEAMVEAERRRRVALTAAEKEEQRQGVITS